MVRTVRIGIGGALGCGKTELIEKLVPKFKELGFKTAVISNDVYSREDARRLSKRLSDYIENQDMIVGIETGGCPHTAVRDDPSMNIDAAERLEKEYPDLDIIFIESGGDNITLTFSPRLADFYLYG
ncbi:GTP-binding protein [Acidiplasma cupricumulans]|uniref:GTP-binding protein n=1 Tax=Acidiplasma cupricumulans TaxID=312540 RepID=UPI000AA0C2B3|nr:GTP-binding protein [Acidiplasma cupricumulans]